MSINENKTIDKLPVEILHRIFDNLDALTILLSIRPVCRLFRAVVNTYNRYKFDFKLISKPNFHLLCRLINPQNLINLTLYDDELIPFEIDLLTSLVRLRQFTRLQSLNLYHIEEFQLNIILKRVNLNFLTSFSLSIQKYDERRKKTTIGFLSLIMSLSTLRNVNLGIKNDRLSRINWSINSRIESLTLNEYIIFDDLHKILSCCPQLRRLTLKTNFPLMNIMKNSAYSYSQITSLIIEDFNINIDEIERFLLMTPSLTYLKLIGMGFINDGKRWEEFIQINLPYLNNFQFFLIFNASIPQTKTYLESIIELYRSPFWVEHKKWFVAYQLNHNQSHQIQCYTIPICKSSLQYELNSSDKTFISNSSISNYDHPSITSCINQIDFTSTIRRDENIDREYSIIANLSSTITKLNIDVDRQSSKIPEKLIKSIETHSKLIQIKIESCYFSKHNQIVLFYLINLIDNFHNLSSLIIESRYCNYELYPYLNDICYIIPRQIKYLKIPINKIEQIEIILERCPLLSVIQFVVTRTKFSDKVFQWFTENTFDSKFRRHNGCCQIWIGKKRNQIDIELINQNKRIKLTEN